MREVWELGEADRELLAAAREAARRAAGSHRRGDPASLASGWSEKGRADFVTEVDREAERRIVETLLERFPHHAVVAEEGTVRAGGGAFAPAAREAAVGPSGGGGSAGGPREGSDPAVACPVRWIVDPLDGTTNWLHGYPEHAVSIAAVDGDGLRLGLVLNSATGERFEAIRDGGARRFADPGSESPPGEAPPADGEPLRVSSRAELRLALVGTGFPFKRRELLPRYLEQLGRAIEGTSGVRRAGSAALDLCDLAAGRLDAFWELWLQPWDVAAGALVVREAGGVFEPLDLPGTEAGEPADPRAPELRPGAFLGAAPSLLAPFRSLVRGEL